MLMVYPLMSHGEMRPIDAILPFFSETRIRVFGPWCIEGDFEII
jgi:hypothetical protein